MATKPKTKKKAPVKKSGKSVQHCKSCGERGHNQRRHKKTAKKTVGKK